jgi:hypothetical protein
MILDKLANSNAKLFDKGQIGNETFRRHLRTVNAERSIGLLKGGTAGKLFFLTLPRIKLHLRNKGLLLSFIPFDLIHQDNLVVV